jgi:RES domain
MRTLGAASVSSSLRTPARSDRANAIDIRALARLVKPVDGPVYCHAPGDRAFDLDALGRPDDEADRWSAPGARSAYLAGDPLVALAEYARHGPAGLDADERRLMQLQLGAVPALDVRDHAVRSVLGLADRPDAYADRELARRHGLAIRESGVCQALVVPSMAFLDQPDRRNIVLFCELLDGGLASVLGEPVEVGRVRLTG